MAAEDREIGAFEVVEDLPFECFEIQIHDGLIFQNQNSRVRESPPPTVL